MHKLLSDLFAELTLIYSSRLRAKANIMPSTIAAMMMPTALSVISCGLLVVMAMDGCGVAEGVAIAAVEVG